MVNRGDEADALLRAVADVLHERLEHVAWVGISLREGNELVVGPSSGERAAGSAIGVPIEYQGRRIGELALESHVGFDDDDRTALERIAKLISQHALVAWDTVGADWDP